MSLLARRPSCLHRLLMACCVLACGPALANEPAQKVLPQWQSTAQKVAQAGVPLSELAPDAPDAHTVKRGDTLWSIAGIFLKSPWRWPELWGMNLEQIRNPHRIYPGQQLVLVKADGRASLRLAGRGADMQGLSTVKLSPTVRSEPIADDAITSVPLHLIGPFLNEAVVFETSELETAPRIVATQEGRVLLSRGETAYVRGDLKGATSFRLFREPRPILDPETREVLGWEARYVGIGDVVRHGEERTGADGKPEVVPATFLVGATRVEANVGDRLAPMPARDLAAYAPRAPEKPLTGRIAAIYGEAISAGQNQIVALNRGQRDGIERGHVLALWRDGRRGVDRTDERRTALKLPDERHGLLFVFRVFERTSYALIVAVRDPVRPGDHFTQP